MNKREQEYLRSPAAVSALKAMVSGFFLGEFSIACFYTLTDLISRSEGKFERYALLAEGGVLSALVVVCLFRYWLPDIRKIASSYRLDLLLALIFGALLSSLFPFTEYVSYDNALSLLTPAQILGIISVPIAVAALHIVRSIALAKLRQRTFEPSFFVSDAEEEMPAQDLLGFREASNRFARRVLNGGSTDSVVFGLDAPWGTGKSTFVNFCVHYWTTSSDSQAIVFRFSPLQYEDRKHLLQKFVDGLVLKIREQVYLPELRTIVSRYSNLVTAKKSISLGGLELELGEPTFTVDDASADIRFALSNLKSRLIVIVDDLDRMAFSEVKDILFVIKKGFSLPNVSFVLCYDTQNIATLEGTLDSEKISEFLEKFVNVKVGLYLSSKDLENYLAANLATAVKGNLATDFRLLDDALGGLRDIYRSDEYHRYVPFAGDVRKIKRLINTLVLLDIHQVDLTISDYDPGDLVRLLLLYINYPNLFRTIYNAETEGRSGFFSLNTKYENGRVTLENSPAYTKFVDSLASTGRANEKFLLDSIFHAGTRLEADDPQRISQDALQSYACFNSNGRRNLERYLNLIVRVSNPPRREQYRFYVSAKNRFLAGQQLDEILAEDDFSFSEDESSHQQFWRVLVNSATELDAVAVTKLINYIVDNISLYSVLEDSKLGLGLRYSSQPYTLLKLLDTVGWWDGQGFHRDNTVENLSGIADWIFGVRTREGSGILKRLMATSRGVLGLRDTMIFRLYSCSDRSSSDNLFNLHRALITYSDPSAPTTGLVTDLAISEMREMSQQIFAMFKQSFIAPHRNIFEEVDKLSLAELTGAFLPHVEQSVRDGASTTAEIEFRVASTKTVIKSFIVYQLTNKLVSSGVGCGYYDEEGKTDEGGIFLAMNTYLFRCFSPEIEANGFEYFLDYLLTQFRHKFGMRADVSWAPDITSITTVLHADLLRQYWDTYRVAFDALRFDSLDRNVVTPNYIASYRGDLGALFEELDKLLLA